MLLTEKERTIHWSCTKRKFKCHFSQLGIFLNALFFMLYGHHVPLCGAKGIKDIILLLMKQEQKRAS